MTGLPVPDPHSNGGDCGNRTCRLCYPPSWVKELRVPDPPDDVRRDTMSNDKSRWGSGLVREPSRTEELENEVERLRAVIASAAVAWICPNCRASFSLPLGMSCDDHKPVATVVFDD